MRRAKIVCTLGPAVATQEAIDALVAAGMDCARLNFSHGDHASHAEMARFVRLASQRAGRPLAILADLSGPKMRIGTFPDGPIDLAEGAEFRLTTRDVPGDEHQVSVSYEPLPRDVEEGTAILLDDGLLRLRVLRVEDETDVVCRVEVGGPLSDRKGLNLPGAKLSTPALTGKDQEDLEFAVGELEVDYVALSFVRSPVDVEEAKRLAKGTPVIAKIEKPEAVARLAEICDAADGCMVARGDLGVEVGAQKVPLIQKRIIRETNARGKVVITATQMLDSMIRNPRPTRAEAADVANAVLDGTDAVMLSGETATGRYPLESVRMMDAILREVEGEWLRGEEGASLGVETTVQTIRDWGDWEFANAAALNAALLSAVLPLKAIVVFTRYGRSANLVAEHRPRAPIVAITADEKSANQLALEWGVLPRVEIPPDDLEETLRVAAAVLAREGLCERGDPFALVTGWPVSARTNTVKLHRL
ncbi:MAG TPA: pyruvate kinase [Polyangiaceae bacterium LLY-WYZ-14_1]|nr:pyruvate kinase [Polyangiaceae bacterium LLY-WYZ-14_1]